MTRALITGASGQDGTYLVERLLDEGTEVHCLSLDTKPCSTAARQHAGDVSDVAGTRELVLEVEPDEIYNLAAVSSVAQSWNEPDLTARINGLAAVGLLESALQVQNRTGQQVRFVQASSAEIFGNPEHAPQHELTPIAPLNPYGAAKAYAHHMVNVYRQRDLHACGLILYNHESPRRPQRFVTRKITAAAAAIADGQSQRLTLGNLDARRDWGWAPDYVDAMVRAARAPVADDYVVATGTSHSVRDFVEAAFHHAGIEDWRAHVDVDPDLLRPADATDLRGDPTRIKEDLGWAPTRRFSQIVGAMVDADRSGGTDSGVVQET